VSTTRQTIWNNYSPSARGPLYRFSSGLRFFFAGLPLLVRHPSLLALSLVPIMLTFAALVALVWGSVWLTERLSETMLLHLSPNMLALAQTLFLLLALFLSYLLYLPLARVLLAPFSEAISRRTTMILGVTSHNKTQGWRHAMWEGAKLVMIQIVVGLSALALGLFFPPIAAPLGLIVAICFVSLDYLDVPLSVRGSSLKEKLRLVRRNKSLTAGFGVAGYLMLIIPVINLLSLPVGVIGATLLVSNLNAEAQRRKGAEKD
jgi:CysZ protein